MLEQVVKDPRVVANKLFALRRLNAHLSAAYRGLLDNADNSTMVDKLGQRLYSHCSDMMFD